MSEHFTETELSAGLGRELQTGIICGYCDKQIDPCDTEYKLMKLTNKPVCYECFNDKLEPKCGKYTI